MHIRLATLLLTANSLATLFADQITLKNGDRLTGAIVKSDEKELVMKTDLAGTVTVPLEAVTAINSSNPLFLTLKDGQILSGTVTTSDGKVQVATKEAGQVTAAKESIRVIRSKDEQTAYEAQLDRLRNPHLLDLWSGSAGASLGGTRGNVNTTSLTLDMNAARTTSRDKVAVYITSLYSRSNATGTPVTTADAIRGGISYNMNITSRVFGFGFTDMEFDKFAKLDFRFVGGGGLGWHAIKTERNVFDLFFGGSYDKAFYSTGLTQSSGEVLFGEEYNYNLSKTVVYHEKLTLFPNLSQTGELRMTFDSSLVVGINKWLGLQFSLSDRYLTNPVPGVKRNDLLYTTGVRVTFAGKNN